MQLQTNANHYQSYNPSMNDRPFTFKPLLLLPAPKTRMQILQEKCSGYKELIQDIKSKIKVLEDEISFYTNLGIDTCHKYRKCDRELAELDGRYKREEKIIIKKRNKEQIQKFNADQLQSLIIALEQQMRGKN